MNSRYVASALPLALLAFVLSERLMAGQALDARVKQDFAGSEARGIVHYVVDPMSETQYLPDAYPEDGRAGVPLKIIAAKGEYEPGAFLLYGFDGYDKVRFELEDLKSDKGDVFPKSKLDLKTVKVWYQAGNAWFSYFADKTNKLCPELLLNDEDMVKVDTEKRFNYARLVEKDGSVRYYWLNEPPAFHNRCDDYFGLYLRLDDTFMCMKPNFMDAAEHKGAKIVKGEFKEFLLTANVGKEQAAGIYRGSIQVKIDQSLELRAKSLEPDAGQKTTESESQTSNVKPDASNASKLQASSSKLPESSTLITIPVVLRVLDFELPRPCCYFDTEKPFKTWFCDYTALGAIKMVNGNDAELARKQLVYIVADFARHGQTIPSFKGAFNNKDIIEEGGQEWSPDVGTGRGATVSDLAVSRAAARELRRLCDKEYGKDVPVRIGWGDEYGLATLRGIRSSIDEYKKQNFLFVINSHSGYSAGITFADTWWPPTAPDRKSAGMAGKFKDATAGEGYFGWYASQHVGCENPAFARRQYGFGPYRAGLSCNYNYAHHLQGWNDTSKDLYRPMMFVYGTGNGCIDTLAWEGFREGQDDIRYATLLKRLAEKHAKGTAVEPRYAARLALKLLADANNDDMDLTTLRREMIVFIEKLLKY